MQAFEVCCREFLMGCGVFLELLRHALQQGGLFDCLFPLCEPPLRLEPFEQKHGR